MVVLTFAACGGNAGPRRGGEQAVPLKSQVTMVHEVYEKDSLRLIVRISEWYDSGHYLPGTSTLVSYGHRRVIESAIGVHDDGHLSQFSAHEAQRMIEAGGVKFVSREE